MHTHGHSPGACKSRLIYPASRTGAKLCLGRSFLARHRNSSGFGFVLSLQNQESPHILPASSKMQILASSPIAFPRDFGQGSPLSPTQLPLWDLRRPQLCTLAHSISSSQIPTRLSPELLETPEISSRVLNYQWEKAVAAWTCFPPGLGGRGDSCCRMPMTDDPVAKGDDEAPLIQTK